MHDDLARLTQAVGDHPRLQILGALVLADEELIVSDILDRTGLSKGGVYNHLDDLVADELIVETRKVGNSQLYVANEDHDVIAGLQSLFSTLQDD